MRRKRLSATVGQFGVCFACHLAATINLTNQSFDMLDAPNARGYFVGDYQGLVRQGSGVRVLFGISTGPGLTDMVTKRVN
jgi:hypothetical protein